MACAGPEAGAPVRGGEVTAARAPASGSTTDARDSKHRRGDNEAFSRECRIVHPDGQRGEVFVHNPVHGEALAYWRSSIRGQHDALAVNLISFGGGPLDGQVAINGRVNRVAQRAHASAVGIDGKIDVENQSKVGIGHHAAEEGVGCPVAYVAAKV